MKNNTSNVSALDEQFMDALLSRNKNPEDEETLFCVLLGCIDKDNLKQDVIDFISKNPEATADEISEYAYSFIPPVEIVNDDIEDEDMDGE